MGCISMQPVNSDESVKATLHLKETGNYLFDLTICGARLKPVAFGFRSCDDNERNFHSFTGKVACGKSAITQNRKYS